MKWISNIVLIIFFMFLVTPTVVAAIDDSIDTSYFFNMSEEESHSSLNEIKSIPSIYSIPMVIDYEGFQKIKFSTLSFIKINSVKPRVLLEPPELV